MTALIILILLVTVYFSLSVIKDSVKQPEANKGCIPHHKWVTKDKIDDNGYLICKTCGKLPGEDKDV